MKMLRLALGPRASLLAGLLLTFAAAAQETADRVLEQQGLEQSALEQPTGQTLDPASRPGRAERDPAAPQAALAEAAADATDAASANANADVAQAEGQDTAASAAPAPILPEDLSPWGMFRQADWVVKAVMIGLVLASIATWTVLVAKTRELRALVKRQRRTLAVVSEADSLKAAHTRLDADSTELTRAAAAELHLSATILADTEGVKERVASCLERLEAASGRRIATGTGILATVGATAPFVGLFGTVWGIMNSFIGISKAQTTNLAVVAPGIAEALLATALGLVAAIPAVVIYNHFARRIAAYRALVGDTSAAILRLVSRDLSRHTVSTLKAAGE